MPSKTGRPYSSYYKNGPQIRQTSNTGVDSTTRVLEDGDVNSTAISLSDDVLSVQPVTDNTTGTMLVKQSGGNNILAVDTTNSKVLLGASQLPPTNYAYFGIDSTGSARQPADIHIAIPFQNSNSGIGIFQIGSSTSSSFNDTDPATSGTTTAGAYILTQMYWYVPDNITIDAVYWLHGADAATGDSTAAHLMAYTVDTANGSTSGDLSGGVVVADGATITNAGYEQVYYQSMTIQSANVDAGKVVLFTFAADTINSDYSINATVKYHTR